MAKMMPFHRRKEKEDDLILFKELQKQKHENDRNLSLLRPVSSDDYEYDLNAHIAEEFPDKAPPNLRTDHRSTSATRGRISNPTSAVVGFWNRDTTPRPSRQSRSPSRSVSRGRKQSEGTQKESRSQKERTVSGTGESRPHVMGSKMVEKVVNARKSATNQAERETKPKPLKNRA